MTLEDIGEGCDALLCKTNQSGTGSALGEWFNPNGTRIFTEIANETTQEKRDIYRTRNLSVVRLNRKRGGMEGTYRCEIPDSLNATQTLYIGVYTSCSGK